MTTPNEDLILKLRGQAYTTCRPDQLCDQAADLLQSQAERIAELEEQHHSAMQAAEKEIEHYRLKSAAQPLPFNAEIAAIDATEPIARAMSDKTNTGYVYVKVLADKLQFGTNLYSHPMPAQDAETSMIKLLDENFALRAELADMAVNTATYEHLVGLANDTATRLLKERDTLRAEIAAIAATEPVYYEFQWTNPGNQPHQPESMFVWARVEPAWNGTVQQKVDELLAYRYDDKPTYRVRAMFTRPMPAQDVEASMINLPEPVAWLANYGGNVYTEAQLKQAVRDAQDAQGVEDAVRYRWLRDYLISPSTHFDDLIVSADKADTLNGVIDAAIAKGAK